MFLIILQTCIDVFIAFAASTRIDVVKVLKLYVCLNLNLSDQMNVSGGLSIVKHTHTNNQIYKPVFTYSSHTRSNTRCLSVSKWNINIRCDAASYLDRSTRNIPLIMRCLCYGHKYIHNNSAHKHNTIAYIHTSISKLICNRLGFKKRHALFSTQSRIKYNPNWRWKICKSSYYYEHAKNRIV